MAAHTQHPGGVSAGERNIVHVYASRRYAILFYSLLATLAAGPLLDAAGVDANVLEFLLAANLLAAVAPLAARLRGVLLTLLAAAFALRAAAAWSVHPALTSSALALWSMIALLAAAGALRFASRASAVDREHLYAALDAYLLIGVFLGVLYWLFERTAPGSLTVANQEIADGLSKSDAIYFSFVTLATLGYGDIVPRSEPARGLAIVEAVAGQLYLAVMIARLVSLYGRNVERPRQP